MTRRQLEKFVRSFRHGILGGKRDATHMCAAICWPLSPLLQAEGVKNSVREGLVKFGRGLGECNHFWIELEDGTVVDPTADQFNRVMGIKLPAVYIGTPERIHTLA